MKTLYSLILLGISLSMSAQVTNTQLKATIDANITNRTSTNKITPSLHGATEKQIVDYIDQQDATKAGFASPTFTGDPKAPTPALTDNDTSIATTAYVKGQKSYKEIILLFNQPSSGVTNMTVVRNDFTGVTITQGSPSAGLYIINSSTDVFTDSKTITLLNSGFYNISSQYRIVKDSANQLSLYQYYNGSLSSGNFMTDLLVYIRVEN